GPISYALAYPDRLPLTNFLSLPSESATKKNKNFLALTFEAPDPKRFPAYRLAYRALETGGTAPAALSGADEAAVAAFLEGRCRFTDIARICGEVLDAHVPARLESIEQASAASDGGRIAAHRRLASH